MAFLGTFHAQHFEWFNRDMATIEIGKDADVNTIYGFIVFSDRIFLVRAGNVANDLKRMLNHYLAQLGVRGTADRPASAGEEGRLVEGARELVKTHKLNREIPLATVARCELRKRHLQYLGLHGSVVLKYPDGRKVVYRFRNPGEWEEAWRILERLGPKALVV